MLRNLLLPATTLSLLIEHTFAQTNSFSNPPLHGVIHDYSANPIWHIGEIQNITWNTDYNQISLVLWQNDNSSAYTMIDNEDAQHYYDSESSHSSLTWQVKIDGIFDLSDGNVFFFQVWETFSNGSYGDNFGSHYFNITDAPATTTTSSSSSMSATASATTSTTTTSSPSPDSGLSTGAEVGIGVGVSLVGIAAVGAALFYCFHSRRRETSREKGLSDPRATQVTSPAPAYDQGHRSYFLDSKPVVEAPAPLQSAPVELSSDQDIRELMAPDPVKPAGQSDNNTA